MCVCVRERVAWVAKDVEEIRGCCEVLGNDNGLYMYTQGRCVVILEISLTKSERVRKIRGVLKSLRSLG